MKKAAIYCRVSSEDQAKQFSLPSQKKELRKLAGSRKFRVSNIYDEGGISGESLSTRPQLLQILEDAEQGEFEYLLIVSLDRLSRNLKDSIYIRGKLQEFGVTIVTPSQEFDHDNIDHDFTANLWGSIADYERKRIKERCDTGRREKRAKGGWLGGHAPKGYQYNPATKMLEVDREAADEVIKILEGSLEHSPLMLARELDKEGIRITPRQIRRMVEPGKILFYSGQVEDYDGNVITGQWPAIISKDLAARIRSAKRRRRVVDPGSTRAKHLLTGLGIFKCRICGSTAKSFTGRKDKKGKRLQYYRCSAIQSGLRCANRKGWQIHILDKVVWDQVQFTIDNLDSIEKQYHSNAANKNGSKKKANLEKQLEKIQGKQSRLVEAVESGSLPVEAVSKRFQDLKTDEDRIRVKLEDENKKPPPIDFGALWIIADKFNFGADFPIEKKRIIIKSFFGKIEISSGSMWIQSNFTVPPSVKRIQLR